jgi:TolA-binding protein
MTRYWKQYGMTMTLASALFAATASAADDQKKNSDGTVKTDPAEQLADQIKKLATALDRLERIEGEFRKTQTENALLVNSLQRDIADLQKKFEKMEQKMTALASQGAITTALKPNINGAADANGMGRVRLYNGYVDPMSVLVNGTSYRLQAGEMKDVMVPAGAMTYQVLRVHASPLARQLAANETLRVNVLPGGP